MIVTTTAPTPHLVVFGRDTSGKPHASWFDQASAELATKAAGLMNMHAVPIKDDALRALAGTLPKGRVFSSGRAFTPFVAGTLYGRLVELTRDVLGLSEGEPAKANGAVPTEAPMIPPAKANGKQPPALPVKPVVVPAKGRPALQLVGAGGSGEVKASGPTSPGTAAPAATRSIALPSRAEDIGIGSLVLASTGPAEGWWEAEVIGLNGTMLTLRWRDYAEPTVVRRRTEVAFLPALQG